MLQMELEADEAARRKLDEAMRRRDAGLLQAALALVAERGLDCDSSQIGHATRLLRDLKR